MIVLLESLTIYNSAERINEIDISQSLTERQKVQTIFHYTIHFGA